jgi:ABC-2 type transport system permease protein
VSRDLRFRMMPLYFSRPLSRSDYVLAKFAAMTTALFALMAIPLVVLYAGALLSKLSFWTQTKGVLTGLAGAVIFALVLAGIGLLVASLTPKRGFGVAAIIVVLIILALVGGILQGVTLDAGHDHLAGYLGAISPFILVDGVQVWIFGATTTSQVGPPGTAGGLFFVVVTIAVIAGCYAALQLRYRGMAGS